MKIATGGTDLGRGGLDAPPRFRIERRRDRQNDTIDNVTRALVIDEIPWPELADGKEPRPREEVVRTGLCAAPWDERGDRQAGEAVSGKKTFAGEVPIGIEIGLAGSAGGSKQKFNLRFCFCV